MSMISAQIDELRERAKVLRQGRWSDGADDAKLMEDAADTIWELRDDLQQANAENARLRGELDSVGTAAYLYGRGDLKDENAKLREPCADLYAEMITYSDAPNYNASVWAPKLRELGAEVG